MTFLSPAFPVGAFSYSHGLEWPIDTGAIRSGRCPAGLAHGSPGTRQRLERRRAFRRGPPRRRGRGHGRGFWRSPSWRKRWRPRASGISKRWRRAGLPRRDRSGLAVRCRATPAARRWCAYPVAVGCRAAATASRWRRPPRLSPRLRREPRLGRRAAGAARPDRRPQVLAALHPLIAATAGGRTLHARRSRLRRRSSPTSPRCATRRSIRGCSAHERTATARCGSASAARSAPARRR